jgi:hypothetical protein
VTIRSSQQLIAEIREAIDQNKKYKTCLSFVPSRVKHISILSGESPIQRFRGFINLASIMFLVLNIRSIIDNFINYGIKFQNTPFEYLPIHFLAALALLNGFPVFAYTIEKLRFSGYLPPFLAVPVSLFLGVSVGGQFVVGSDIQHLLLRVVQTLASAGSVLHGHFYCAAAQAGLLLPSQQRAVRYF